MYLLHVLLFLYFDKSSEIPKQPVMIAWTQAHPSARVEPQMLPVKVVIPELTDPLRRSSTCASKGGAASRRGGQDNCSKCRNNNILPIPESILAMSLVQLL
jgi:hypothetical protein